MPRRQYYASPQCAYEGCQERANYVFDTRGDQRETMQRIQRDGWYCVRHSRAGEVLSADEPVKETVLEIYETDFGHGRSMHQFWTELENVAAKKGGGGFRYGPGFKAFAKDFPVGTRLVVTARVELPDSDASPRIRLSEEENHDG